MSNSLAAIDAAEQLRRWDAGETIWTIEMGGMGPGYEQAIQVCAIEIVRDNLGKALPVDGSDEIRVFGDSTLSRIDNVLGGLTGAMFGAARQLAYKWIQIGPAKVLEHVPVDRRIQCSNAFPVVKTI